MFFEAASLGLSLFGLGQSRRARKREEERLRIETGRQRRAGQMAEDDLFVEASAATAQRRLLVERETLAEKASDEALRQAKMQQDPVDVDLAVPNYRARSRTRKSFFDEVV